MRENLSKYKFERLAVESLRNGLRLHFDSILLYYRGSHPSALQLSIIAMEEIAKAKWVDHYLDAQITNQSTLDVKFEQKWLKMLYFHGKKQSAFFRGDFMTFSPSFIKFVESGKLEELKQKATYVGLKKGKKEVDVNSRVSTPLKINEKESRKIISLINTELQSICSLNIKNEGYFWIQEMNLYIDNELLDILDIWEFKSGLKSPKWEKKWFEKIK